MCHLNMLLFEGSTVLLYLDLGSLVECSLFIALPFHETHHFVALQHPFASFTT